MEIKSVQSEDEAGLGYAVGALRQLATSLDLLDQVAADGLGIARSDLRCLDVLARRQSVTAGDLGRAVGLSAAATSAALNRLEARDFVVRTPSVTDRRAVVVRMTDVAVRATAQAFAQVHQLTLKVLGDLSAAERTVVATTARRLAAEISAALADPSVSEE